MKHDVTLLLLLYGFLLACFTKLLTVFWQSLV